MVETLTLLLDLCAGKSWSPRPSLPLATFQSFKKLPDKTNKYNCFFCLETLLAQNLFLSNWARERGKRHLRKGCMKAGEAQEDGRAPRCPCPSRQRFSNHTFLSEAAAPHHTNAVTKRRRYYGKDFSGSYSRVGDSAAGSSLGNQPGTSPCPGTDLARARGWRSGAASCPGDTGGPSPGRPHRWCLGKMM